MGLIKNIFTLGGSYRQEKAEARHRVCWSRYQDLNFAIERAKSEVDETVLRLKNAFGRTKRDLAAANRMLLPLVRLSSHSSSPESPSSASGTAMLYKASLSNSLSSTQFAIGGAAIGTSAAILAWQGAQIVGIASTGTAMLGLHGAAASNAGWALFGGGSLATGGGGMALGHLVLPGVGIAVAVGIGAISTHRRANEINNACDQIEAANITNEVTLTHVDAGLRRLRQSERTYEYADLRLRDAVKLGRNRLRRFGLLSVAFRSLRLKLKGFYYTAEEENWAAELESEIKAFFSAVGFEKT